MDTNSHLTQRFRNYFERAIALQAAQSLVEGACVEFRIQPPGASEVSSCFHLLRHTGKNETIEGPAPRPEIIFTLTPQAAEEILNDPASDIATIGINITKLIMTADPTRKISIKLNAGFLDLFTKGYLGVIATGGHQFASHLATLGLNGLGAIKDTIRNLRK